MKLALLLALSAAVAFQKTEAHAWLTKPVSRETSAREDPSGSMGCPSSTPGQVTSFNAGERIDVRYWRNNHKGGFIRWAIVPQGNEAKESFDANVFMYTCRESGPTCLPKGENTVYAGDNSGDNTIACGDSITLPDWLPQGQYVLQWTWFGAGGSYGHLGWANAQYRSCADISLTNAGNGSQPSCPTFVGGDRVTKLEGKSDDQCFYFRDNAIVSSIFEGSDDDYEQYYKYGVPAQVEACGGGATTPSPPSGGADDTNEPPSGSGDISTGKSDWQMCSSNSECANQCCSKKYSDDGKMKCTPGGCAAAADATTEPPSGNAQVSAGKNDWQFCTSSSECANQCCSKKFSDDGKMKCTPGGC